MARLVSLLTPKIEPTARQRAQRKYRKSAKGRAANARARDKRRLNPLARKAAIARVVRWRRENPVHVRVYDRIRRRRRRNELRRALNPNGGTL